MFSFNQFDTDKNTFIFYNQGTSSVRTVPFIKPLGINFVHILAVGGGGGGGAGCTWVSSTVRHGGGGGGGGGVTVGIFPANLLPDTLYVSVGQGGSGGTSGIIATPGTGNNGIDGTSSTIYLVNQPNISGSGGILLTAFGGDGGTGGSQSSSLSINGFGGNSLAGPTLIDMPMACLGIFTSTPSTTGADSNFPGDDAEPFSYSFVSGGGGGGIQTLNSTPSSGGSCGLITNGNEINIPVISGGSALNDGQDGITLFKPYFVSLGGGGGGAGTMVNFQTPLPGGDGGKGGLGSGGGGGGSGNKQFTGDPWNAGFGGRGGDGIVIISCW